MYNDNFQEIHVTKEEQILWLSLNRPEASNAFTTVMIKELIDTLAYADEDNDVRCIVITGEGRHFCAGGDIKNMLEKKEMFQGEANELRERYKRGIQKIPWAFYQLSTPTVAMVNGAAIGAGLDLACMCDLRVASSKAKFGETFSKLALVPGDGGTYFLQRIVGYAKAMEMTLTAGVYNAEEAKSFGLVNFVEDPENLREKTEEIAKKITSCSPIATQMTKRAIQHAYHSDLPSNLDLLAAYQGITQNTADHFEALEKAKAKKAPDFNHK